MTLHVRNPVGDLARREPICVAPHETLREVSNKMWAEAVGLLIVGDARAPLGVISERDVVAKLARSADPDTTTAREAMTTCLISARPEDPLFDLAAQMIDDEIRHFPVVDETGKVVGMVSVRDLLRPLLIDALGGSTSTDSSVS